MTPDEFFTKDRLSHLTRIAKRFIGLRPRCDIEDIASDAVLNAIKSWYKCRNTGESGRWRWVVSILYFSIYHYLKQTYHPIRYKSLRLSYVAGDYYPSKEHHSEKDGIIKCKTGTLMPDCLITATSKDAEFNDSLNEVSKHLSDLQLFILKCKLSGYSCREIASTFSIPLGSVFSGGNELRHKLARLLKEGKL